MKLILENHESAQSCAVVQIVPGITKRMVLRVRDEKIQ